jgi:hypothetical protein
MPQAWETLNGTWVVAACFIALLISFGMQNKRSGWKKERRDGAVPQLLKAWLRWNRSLAPAQPARAGNREGSPSVAGRDAAPLRTPGLLARRSSV